GKIELQFAGADSVKRAANGDLVLTAAGREMRFQAPHIYQRSGGEEQTIAGNFAVLADGHIGFEIGAYDQRRALIIDPVLVFSTYLGGPGDESCAVIANASQGFVPQCPAVALDSSLSVYVAG